MLSTPPVTRKSCFVWLTCELHQRLERLAARVKMGKAELATRWIVPAIAEAARQGTIRCDLAEATAGRDDCRQVRINLTIPQWEDWLAAATRLQVSQQTLAFSIIAARLNELAMADG